MRPLPIEFNSYTVRLRTDVCVLDYDKWYASGGFQYAVESMGYDWANWIMVF